jgi:hypothetical protein
MLFQDKQANRKKMGANQSFPPRKPGSGDDKGADGDKVHAAVFLSEHLNERYPITF